MYSWDDETELNFWKNDTGSMCNALRGTDGSTFHPDIKRDETLYIFNRDLCRSLPLVYQKDVIDGNNIPGYRFVIFHNQHKMVMRCHTNISLMQWGLHLTNSWLQKDENLRFLVSSDAFFKFFWYM